jgi:hypothetical protein
MSRLTTFSQSITPKQDTDIKILVPHSMCSKGKIILRTWN